MHNDPIILAVGDYLFSASAIPALAFLLYYAWPKLGAPWWRTPVGRMFVLSQVSLILVSTVVIFSLTFGEDYPGRAWFRVVGYGLHFIAQCSVFLTYYAVRHQLPKRRGGKEKAPTEAGADSSS